MTYYYLSVTPRVDERENMGQKSTELNQGCTENAVALIQGDKSFGEVASWLNYLNQLCIEKFKIHVLVGKKPTGVDAEKKWMSMVHRNLLDRSGWI